MLFRSLETDTCAPYLQKALDAPTELHDDHPSLTERLTWLKQAPRTLPPPSPCAAEHFLQDRALQFIGVASVRWKESQQLDWAGEFDTQLARQRRLVTCAIAWKAGKLTDPEEVRLYGRLLEEFEAEKAPAFYRDLMARKDGESYGRLALGRLLLADGEREGLALLEEARLLQFDALASVIPTLRAYLEKHGPDERAECLLAQALGESPPVLQKAA